MAAQPLPTTRADDYWSSRTDAQLLAITWSISDPRTLDNLQHTIPHDLGSFVVQVDYQIEPTAEPVRCAHCPQHQRHWRGYVLLADDGRRFLLGSKCGPKAYGADYMAAAEARKRAKKRCDLLVRYHRLRSALPDLVEALSDAVQGADFKVVRRARAALEHGAPALLMRLRRETRSGLVENVELRSVRKVRDTEAEQKAQDEFQTNAKLVAHLPNKLHRAALDELTARFRPYVPVYRTDERNFGVLRASKVMLTPESPNVQAEGALNKLRARLAVNRSTEGRPNTELSQEVRVIELCIDAAANALSVIRSAGQFFEAEALKALAAWASLELDHVAVVRADGNTLHVNEHHQAPLAVTLGSDWVPPGDLFLDLAQEFSSQRRDA